MLSVKAVPLSGSAVAVTGSAAAPMLAGVMGSEPPVAWVDAWVTGLKPRFPLDSQALLMQAIFLR